MGAPCVRPRPTTATNYRAGTNPHDQSRRGIESCLLLVGCGCGLLVTTIPNFCGCGVARRDARPATAGAVPLASDSVGGKGASDGRPTRRPRAPHTKLLDFI